MRDWREIWRKGVAPFLSDGTLRELATEIEAGGPRLIQRVVVEPLPWGWNNIAEKACLLGFCVWQDAKLTTSKEVFDSYQDLYWRINERIEEPLAARRLFTWFDCRPRDEVQVKWYTKASQHCTMSYLFKQNRIRMSLSSLDLTNCIS